VSTSVPFKTFRGFKGINNVEDSLRLADTDLAEAVNVDIDDTGMVTTKKGKTLILAGDYRWIWSNGIICLGIRGDDLVSIAPGFTSYTTLMTGVGKFRMEYTQAKNRVYFTNSVIIGYVENAQAHLLPAPTEAFMVPMPPGDFIRYAFGRLWVALGPRLYPSDPLSLNEMDARLAPKQFGGSISMLEFVKNGMYAATDDATYFISGTNPDEMIEDARKLLAPYGAIPRLSSQVAGEFIVEGKNIKGTVVFWGSDHGICMGTDDGEFINLTAQQYEISGGVSAGASLFRINHKGAAQVIMTTT